VAHATIHSVSDDGLDIECVHHPEIDQVVEDFLEQVATVIGEERTSILRDLRYDDRGHDRLLTKAFLPLW